MLVHGCHISLELRENTKEFLGPLPLSVAITVESISKGQAVLPSPPLVNEFFFKHQEGRGVSDSPHLRFGFDALHPKADICAGHRPGTTPLRQADVWPPHSMSPTGVQAHPLLSATPT